MTSTNRVIPEVTYVRGRLPLLMVVAHLADLPGGLAQHELPGYSFYKLAAPRIDGGLSWVAVLRPLIDRRK